MVIAGGAGSAMEQNISGVDDEKAEVALMSRRSVPTFDFQDQCGTRQVSTPERRPFLVNWELLFTLVVYAGAVVMVLWLVI